ncbi:polysaccharide deacetylase family protein [Neobacillus mesonae]|uniref:polysaccharide deacetylase family protein n=1 Tax=Neobacillus mesonae TaxID=1193713 RepID=UPI00203FE0E3|nr:polysaccharide deacetylase family protein [Neobacillus mesonae]MCM3570318.1 polysaccharide deacetylase family protein [Neobacillus mesonae]
MITFILIIAILILLVLLYSVIPTVLIRVLSLRITKRTKTNGMALTFDDGPNPEYTPQLLDLLKKYGVKATFFVVGSKVKQYPEIIKRMNREGHTIGIHHFKHISGWILSPFQLKKQLKMTEVAISNCTNEKVTFYRPPWGHFNLFTLLMSKKYNIIMWSDIFGDWKTENCKNTLLDQLRSTNKQGSILLLHDSGENPGADEEAPHYMLQSLETYLKENHETGTRYVTLKNLSEEDL